MNKRSEQNSDLNRRDLVKSAAAVGLALTAGVQGTHQASAAPTAGHPIRQENAKPGTRDWMLTKTALEAWRHETDDPTLEPAFHDQVIKKVNARPRSKK